MPGPNRMTGQQAPTKCCVHTFPASVAIAVGDLGYKDTSAGKFYPMSSFTWTTDLATTRLLAARQFAGISNERRLSTETDSPDGVVNCGGEACSPCAALGTAAKAGALVTFGDNGDSTLSKTVLAITTDPALAIGRLSRPAAVGATQLYWFFDSNATTDASYGLTLPNSKLTSGTAATFVGSDISGAAVVNYINTGNNATLTLPTAAAMLAATPGGHIGMNHMLLIRNTHATTATVTADGGATFTLSGTMTIAQNTTRIFNVNLVSATAATMTSLGTGAAAA